MGWKAIKSLNKQEHLDREAAGAVPSEETTTAKNAVRELPPPLSETHEVITGPGGWAVAVPFETTEESEATILPEGETTSVTEEVSTDPAKKPSSSGKKRK